MSNQHEEDPVKEQLFNLASDAPGIYEAARLWFERQGPEISSALADALEDERLGSVGHWRVLRLLQEFANEETLPAILKAFDRAFARRDYIVIPGAMEALAVFHTPEANRALIALLDESNLDIVKHAAVLVGHTGDPNGVAPLLRLLASDDPSLRFSVTRGLVQFDTPSVRAALRRHLEAETNPEVRDLIISSPAGGD